mgnify:CR=1 FL=1
MSTGFLRAVLETFPDSQVDIILKSGFEILPIPHRGETILFDKNKDSAGKFGKSLRQKNYDCFYVLPPSFSSAWMAFQSKIPKRIGYAGEYRSFLLTSAKKYEIRSGSQHLLKEYLDLLSSDIDIKNYAPSLEVKNNWVKEQLDSFTFKIPEKFIVFTPGAIYGPSKQWPVEHYRELGEKFDNEIVKEYNNTVKLAEAEHSDKFAYSVLGLGHKIKSEDKLQQIADKFVAQYPVVELLHWDGSHASDRQIEVLINHIKEKSNGFTNASAVASGQ